MLLLENVGNYLAEHPESICSASLDHLEDFYRRLTAGAYEAREEDTERVVPMKELHAQTYMAMLYYQIFPKPNLGHYSIRYSAAALTGQPFCFTDAIRILTRLHSCVVDISQQLSDEAASEEAKQAVLQGMWLDGGLLVSHCEAGVGSIFLRRSYLSPSLNAHLAVRALNTVALYGFLPRQK